MSGHDDLTRREVLRLGAAATAVAATRPLTTAVAAADSESRGFASVADLRGAQERLDAIGLRATGSRAHERYVDDLRERLERAGVTGLRFESVPFRRWNARQWSLHVLDAAGARPVPVTSYAPYSGQTPRGGVSGPLAVVGHGAELLPGSLTGKIAIFDVPVPELTLGLFVALAYRSHDPAGVVDAADPYVRPWLADVAGMLDRLQAAGAAGAIGVMPMAYSAALGAYMPYDGRIRSVPTLYVDQREGARLEHLAGTGARARLTVMAGVHKAKTRNLIGFIPGASDELVMVHSHTDGTNGIEDNGCEAIIAISRYLAGLPRRRLPRTIAVLLTSGHFAGGVGAEAFIRRHRGGLLARITSAVTVEHLGAEEWSLGADGRIRSSGRLEPGAFFAPRNSALVRASHRMLERSRAAPGYVLRPLNEGAPGTASQPVWPGEGQYLYGQGSVPTANYITGPVYLLNAGMRTVDKVDFKRLRREAIGVAEMLVALGRVPARDLRRLDLGG
jgi:peptidase M28-like protein